MNKGRRHFVVLVLLAAVGAASGQVSALSQADIRRAALTPVDEGYVLDVDIDLQLNSRLAEAVTRGVALHFVAEFELSQPRWYWFDREVVRRKREFRLSYHAITRAYRLSTGTLHRSFDTLDDAVAAMARIRHWRVIGREEVAAGESYDVALRFRHDQAELPRPFQVTSFGNRDGVLDSGWTRWTLSVPADTP